MKTQLWMGGLLFASLALNLFLGGMVIGRQAAPERGERFKAFQEQIEMLPETERKMAQEVIHEYRPKLKEEMQALREQRQNIFALIQSDNYSRAEAEERFRALREQTLKVQALTQAMMLDLADQLGPEKRAALLQSQGKALP